MKKETVKRGRPPTPVITRASKLLDIGVDLTKYAKKSTAVPERLREKHWYLKSPKNTGPKKLVRKTANGRIIHLQEQVTIPRVKDEDGSLKSIARVLFREIFGYDYPYTLRRANGCDLNCVNPFHMAQPSAEYEEVPTLVNEQDKELEELVEAIANFIGTNGRDEDTIFAHFGIDYTELEIIQALARVA